MSYESDSEEMMQSPAILMQSPPRLLQGSAENHGLQVRQAQSDELPQAVYSAALHLAEGNDVCLERLQWVDESGNQREWASLRAQPAQSFQINEEEIVDDLIALNEGLVAHQNSINGLREALIAAAQESFLRGTVTWAIFKGTKNVWRRLRPLFCVSTHVCTMIIAP